MTKARIGIIGDNSIEFVEKVLQIWNENKSVVIVDWRIPVAKRLEMLNAANVTICYIQEQYMIDSMKLNNIKFIPYAISSQSYMILPKRIYQIYTENYDISEALILFSSGTTGKSKGVILSHYAKNLNADAIIKQDNITKEDSLFVVKSFAHSSAFVSDLLVALKTQALIAIGKTVMPPRYLINKMYEYGTTILNVNPTILSMYLRNGLDKKLGKLRAIYVSGSRLNNELALTARAQVAPVSVYNVYGLTEAGPRVTSQTDENCHGNSAGIPITGVHIKVVDAAGREVPINTIGTIYVKSQSMFMKYLNSELFTDEWLNTRDIGFINQYNELEIVGREDDMIITHAHNVYPSAIEDIVESFEEIDRCIVVGIPHNELGEIVVCAYTQKEGTKIEAYELYSRCRSILASYEIPHKWINIDYIPANANGKIDRKQVKNSIIKILEEA